MTPETRERICAMLSEVLVLLDTDAASIGAVHVAHAMDALCDRPIAPPGAAEPSAWQ